MKILRYYYFFICSFNKLLLQKEELEQKHLHLLQIVESEKTAKWQYTQQCEELAVEIKKLRAEVCFINISLLLLLFITQVLGELNISVKRHSRLLIVQD